MRHRANPRFWRCYHQLPQDIRRLADESYRMLLDEPHHPSLRFKKIGPFWEVVWFWVGPHAEYDRLIGHR